MVNFKSNKTNFGFLKLTMKLNNILKKFKELSFFDTFKHASTYFSGTMLIHGLGILTLPVYTAYLSTEEYGIINVFTSYISFILVLISFYAHGAINRYYFEKDTHDFASFLGSLFVFVHINFILFGGLIYYFRAEIAAIVNLDASLVLWVIAMAIITIHFYFYQQVMIASKQSKSYTIVEVSWHYVKFFFTVVGFLYITSYADNKTTEVYLGKIIGEFLATCCIVVYTTKILFKYLSFKNMRIYHLKYALSYTVPLIPFAISGFILNSFDQWYIIASVGQAEAGQYAFAYKIGMLFLGLITALLNGAQPEYFDCMNQQKYKQVSDQVSSITKLLVLGASFLILFAVDIGTLLSSQKVYLEVLPLAPVIIVAYIFHGISSLYNRGIYYKKKNQWLALIIIISGALNVLLNIYFINRYGFKAAAYTTMASYFVMMVLSILLTTCVLKLPPLPLGRILKYIVLLAIIISMNYIFGAPNVALSPFWILYKGALFALLGAGLFYNKIGIFFNK